MSREMEENNEGQLPILDFGDLGILDNLEHYEPVKTPRGSYISGIGLRISNNQVVPISIETPRLTTTSGIYKSGHKCFIDFEIDSSNDKVGVFYKFLNKLEGKITELKSGGVDTSFKLEPPNTQTLLDNAHKKIIETHIEIEKTYLEINKQSKAGISKSTIEPLLIKLKTLKEQKKQWQIKINEINKDMNTTNKEAA